MRSAASLLLGLALCAAINAARPAPYGAALTARLEPETAVETASLMGLGLRRLAADLGLIRLLVYYGTAEKEVEGHHDEDWGGGHYPEMGPRALRILDLDPTFAYAAFYAAGALAFNLDRPAEALKVLEYGLKRDPGNTSYHAYIGAIGFHRRGDQESVIRLLEPLAETRDCPTMIKSMLAFLYARKGLKDKAAGLYRDIRDNSRDYGYRSTAERKLKELGF